ncbi:MAG: hypothetical protein HC772_18770 [Leptolyngbyaceae cyanobacterium CRU_2_3]|nr:hypothetical protein [Leptolyngbyaceae cyanobacterium CRU_2_3]
MSNPKAASNLRKRRPDSQASKLTILGQVQNAVAKTKPRRRSPLDHQDRAAGGHGTHPGGGRRREARRAVRARLLRSHVPRRCARGRGARAIAERAGRAAAAGSHGYPRFYDLLKTFDERSGCPVLINTSFNVRGEPIVCTPDDAYLCFMRTDMDVLVLGNQILLKEEQPPLVEDFDWRERYALD